MSSRPGIAEQAAGKPPVVSRLRALFGLPRSFVVAGVRYREVTGETLRRALSRKGSGRKEYDAAFPRGEKMRIACTPQRVYADLMPAPLLAALRRADTLVRPGMRVLVLGAGTGYVGEWAARLVGPSGTAVMLESDDESVRYAERRYPLPNVGFERGAVEALAGETDGAFDAAIAAGPGGSKEKVRSLARELWRLVRDGGWIGIAWPEPESAPAPDADDPFVPSAEAVCRVLTECPSPPPGPDPHDAEPPADRGSGPSAPAPEVLTPPGEPWGCAILRKPRADS